MEHVLQQIQTITIVIFMVGNLLEVGLRLEVEKALAALRHVLASPGLNARLRSEFDLPTVTATGPLGEPLILSGWKA